MFLKPYICRHTSKPLRDLKNDARADLDVYYIEGIMKVTPIQHPLSRAYQAFAAIVVITIAKKMDWRVGVTLYPKFGLTSHRLARKL